MSVRDMLLKAKIRNVDEWKAIINAIGDIADEAMFICNDDGITFRGMDPAHVALLDITFPKSSFEELESHTSFFGIRVADFGKILNAAENGDIIELQIDKNEIMNVKISGNLQMEYSLRLIEKSEVNTPIPRVEAKSQFSLSPKAFTKIISNIEKISNHVTINALSDKIEFSGKGDIGDARIDLEKGNPDLSSFNVSENSISAYSLEYMTKIIRSIGKACKSVNIEYGNKTPMHLLFQMPSMTKVEYYLAPRVEN